MALLGPYEDPEIWPTRRYVGGNIHSITICILRCAIICILHNFLCNMVLDSKSFWLRRKYPYCIPIWLFWWKFGKTRSNTHDVYTNYPIPLKLDSLIKPYYCNLRQLQVRKRLLKIDWLIMPYNCNLCKLQVHRRLLSNLTLLMSLPWTEPKLLQGLLWPRAPPWYFLPKIQPCLPPRICPPITNPLTVKLPLSIQWTPTSQWRLFRGISSLMAHPPFLVTSSAIWRRGGCKKGTNTAGKATLSSGGPLDG